MAPRTEEQLEQHKASKKNEIIDAALQVFATKGFEGASISQIAKQAKISKGLIYSYFDNKESLLLDSLMKGFELMGSDFSEDFTLQSKDDFKLYVDKMFDMLDTKPLYWKVYFGVFLQPTVIEIMKSHLGTFLDPYLEVFTQYYRSQSYEKPEIHAKMFLAFLDGIGMHLLYFSEGIDRKAMKELIAERFG